MPRRFGVVVVVAAAAALGGCGTPAPAVHHPQVSASPSPSPSPKPTSVTIIAPDGVNFRSSPSTTASVLGVVAQGVTLAIVSETSAGGGWWEVRGSTATGWVTSNPEYVSTGSFQTYQSGGTGGWSVLYPAGWQFAQQSTGALAFNGPGSQTISVTQASTTAQLPAAAPSGTGEKDVAAVEIYGVTTSLVTFAVSSEYLAAVAFQAAPGLAFLIVAKGPSAASAASFQLFLSTFKFPLPAASPTP